MAEFVEVSFQLGRMCREYSDCADCQLYDSKYCTKTKDKLTRKDLREAEAIIMQWANENPGPAYPTWGEWFESRGDLISGWNNTTSVGWLYNRILEVFHKPIPDDIAEKLGVKPKEVKKDG